MRALNNSFNINNNQFNQLNAPLISIPVARKTPFMPTQSVINTFNPVRAEMALLAKRRNQAIENLYHEELCKKVKSSIVSNNNYNPLMVPNLANMIFQQNQNLIETQQQLQNLNFLLNIKPEVPQIPQIALKQNRVDLKPQQPTKALKIIKENKEEKITVKEEYVQQTHQEELLTSQGSPSSKSEVSQGKIEVELSALTDFTQQFPDWDLSTIFHYIKSGKSMDVYEKERKIKLENKEKKKELKRKQKQTKNPKRQ